MTPTRSDRRPLIAILCFVWAVVCYVGYAETPTTAPTSVLEVHSLDESASPPTGMPEGDEESPRSSSPNYRFAAQSKKDEDSITVYATRTGAKYHRGSCQYLRQSKIPMPLKEARRMYDACKVCRPPQ